MMLSLDRSPATLKSLITSNPLLLSYILSNHCKLKALPKLLGLNGSLDGVPLEAFVICLNRNNLLPFSLKRLKSFIEINLPLFKTIHERHNYNLLLREFAGPPVIPRVCSFSPKLSFPLY